MAAPLRDHASAQAAEPDISERLVAMLDLQRVGEGADAWTVHVIGVHSDGEDLWIQVAPHPDGTDSFVLRLSSHATVRQALVALAAAPRTPRDVSPIVTVMRNVY
jgi:hypothetical protein